MGRQQCPDNVVAATDLVAIWSFSLGGTLRLRFNVYVCVPRACSPAVPYTRNCRTLSNKSCRECTSSTAVVDNRPNLSCQARTPRAPHLLHPPPRTADARRPVQLANQQPQRSTDLSTWICVRTAALASKLTPTRNTRTRNPTIRGPHERMPLPQPLRMRRLAGRAQNTSRNADGFSRPPPPTCPLQPGRAPAGS